MKKIIDVKSFLGFLFILVLSVSVLSGCGKKDDATTKTDDKKTDTKESTDKSTFSKDKPFFFFF